jgi:hypothetical protein
MCLAKLNVGVAKYGDFPSPYIKPVERGDVNSFFARSSAPDKLKASQGLLFVEDLRVKIP